MNDDRDDMNISAGALLYICGGLYDLLEENASTTAPRRSGTG